MTETMLRPAVLADLPVIFSAERDYIKAMEPGQEAACTARVSRPQHLHIRRIQALPDTVECCIGCDKACISNHVVASPPPR